MPILRICIYALVHSGRCIERGIEKESDQCGRKLFFVHLCNIIFSPTVFAANSTVAPIPRPPVLLSVADLPCPIQFIAQHHHHHQSFLHAPSHHAQHCHVQRLQSLFSFLEIDVSRAVCVSSFSRVVVLHLNKCVLILRRATASPCISR